MLSARLWNSLLLVGLLLVLGVRNGAAFEDFLNPNNLAQPCHHYNPVMNATHEWFRGQDVIWQIPPNPRAILLRVHAREKTPLTFFDYGPYCKTCYGLPEDRLVTLAALERGYAVISLKSISTDWVVAPIATSPDIDNTVDLLKSWREKHHLERLPLVAWGHSLGATFVVSLAATYRLPLSAVVINCPVKIENLIPFANSQFPPTMLVHMAGQRYDAGFPTDEEVAGIVSTLRQEGVWVSTIRCLPKPVTPFFFSERIHCMTLNMSLMLYERLREDKNLDSDSYLVENPLYNNFVDFMYNITGWPYCAKRHEMCLAMDVREELKLAYGVHALTNEGNTEIFAWFHSILELDSDGIVKEVDLEGVAMPELSDEHRLM